ncbi:MAG: 50S ribosomal protein L9 [Gammaproteobacteria bacterium]|uniref:LSU ribosomal protein L9p n=1 Tax=hydrothermal vent metagenome TaxID=652676 RepID=A0A1W1E6J3_9ZZZZ|nr:50S ribosomal protein L9 [Gammaproteobacteria bacterium]
MQVILLETIGKLGDLGDTANVKAGYARNFLIPQGKVKPATAANMAEFKAIKADLQAKEAETIKAAETKAAAMTGVVCSLKANASDEGKLFGSITTADIVASLATAGHEVEKRDINLSEAIHHIGEYDISVTLHTDINVDVKVVVESLEGE